MFKEYFTNYHSPTDMCNKLIDPENVRINEMQVDSIKKTLTRMKNSIEKVPKKYDFRIKRTKKQWYCWKDSWF